MMSERYTTDELQTQTERGDELAAQVEGLIMERDALAADNAALRAQLAAREHAACPRCGQSLHGEKLLPF